MAKVSIIVPVYGVEKYLEKCVNSLIHQSLKDIEIILIDDGSPDKCPQMCDEFASKDSRIVVVHKVNGGLSDARNVGVKYASTNYIIFVDSDDYVESNMCEVLYQYIIEHDCDIVTSLVNEIKDGQMVGNRDSFMPIKLSKEEALLDLLSGDKITMYAVGKIYRKELLERVPYPVGKLYEDAFTTPYIIHEASSIYVTSERLYNYLRRNDSITLAKYSKHDLDCIEAHRKNRDYFKNRYPLLNEALDFRYYWALMYIYDKILINKAFSNEEAKGIWAEIKKNKMKILKNNFVSKKRKLALMMMLVSRKVYLKVLKRIGG